MTIARAISIALCLVVGGCLTETSDDAVSLGETVHEVEGSQKPTSTSYDKCASPKVELCHLPGGDPSKAVTLCIAASAVDTHQFHHGDSLGECAPYDECSPDSGVCSIDTDCCDGFCAGGMCRTTCQPMTGSCDSSGDCCNGGGCVDEACVPQI